MNKKLLRRRFLRAGSALAMTAVLAACGQVAVFGRTIGEPKQPEQMKADSVIPQSKAAEAQKSPASVRTVRSVALRFAKNSAAEIKADPKFDGNALQIALETELRTRYVLDSGSQVATDAEVVIEEYRLEPTSNAIVFGQIISTGTLNGFVRLRDAKGVASVDILIQTKTKVSIPAKGQTKNPLAPLYRQFAVQTGDALTGETTKPAQPANWPPR